MPGGIYYGSMATREDSSEFEAEVRAVARALWGAEPGEGAPLTLDGRERDCIFYQDDLVNYVECTVDRKTAKIHTDGKKLSDFRDKTLKRNIPVKLWMVTKEEPTGEQSAVARSYHVTLLSLKEFKRKLFDADTYIALRRNYPFGSATDPNGDTPDLSRIKYQPAAIRDRNTNELYTVEQLVQLLDENRIICLLGDYGMGKSILVHRLFEILAKRYLRTKDTKPPVAVNLRDHWNQEDPHELLERHAKKLGFKSKAEHILRAYNGAELCLLIDGFDEITSKPLSGHSKLADLRRQSLNVVKALIQSIRGRTGLLIVGREHFFDNDGERSRCLGLLSGDPLFRIGEFSEEEAQQFLDTNGVKQIIPGWLPRRPLLLASLIHSGVLKDLGGDQLNTDPAASWDHLLNLICMREARIHKTLDFQSIRKMLEALATKARSSSSGSGPIYEADVFETYESITGGQHPDDTVRPLLLRLPGLSSRNSQDGSREFLDESMLSALRAASLTTFLSDPYSDPKAQQWKHGIGEVGLEVAKLCRNTLDHAGYLAVNAAIQAESRWKCSTLSLDLVQLALELPATEPAVDFSGLHVKGGEAMCLDFAESKPPARLTISDAMIHSLILPTERLTEVRLVDCVIHRLFGASSIEQLPPWIDQCIVEEFDPTHTNAAIMLQDDIPVPCRVLLTILRKLFIQRGLGRVHSALIRGLELEARTYVDRITDILSRHRLITHSQERGNTVWHPVRSERNRVMQIIDNVRASKDPSVVEVRAIR
jgi:NACHT domain